MDIIAYPGSSSWVGTGTITCSFFDYLQPYVLPITLTIPASVNMTLTEGSNTFNSVTQPKSIYKASFHIIGQTMYCEIDASDLTGMCINPASKFNNASTIIQFSPTP